MASAKTLTPGAAILRKSRVFSLPSSIAPPPRDQVDGHFLGTETMTLPYPTHQSITTPKSSRMRGDWGLKRPFPLRTTTKSSTPMISVKQIDSVEHITDFSSSANHGLSLRKFQELNLPVTMPSADKSNNMVQRRSVFEEDGDFVAIEPGKDRTSRDKRWKFRGPWISGMSPGEFDNWLSKKVRHRRPEFQVFLKQKLATKMTESKQSAAADDGGLDLGSTAAVDPSTVTEEQLIDFHRTLRTDKQQLYELISEFLDLAPLQPPDVTESLGSLVNYGSVNLRLSESPYAESGPPMSHPSGGISYLRTGSYLDNHPVYGPQANHPPTQARILSPRSSNGFFQGTLGVGGFIPSTSGDHHLNSRDIKNVNLRRFNPDIKGGAKVYVQATKASFDSRGRMVLNVKQADMQDECIAKELIGEDKVFAQSRTFNEAANPAHAQLRRPVGMGYGRAGSQAFRRFGMKPE